MKFVKFISLLVLLVFVLLQQQCLALDQTIFSKIKGKGFPGVNKVSKTLTARNWPEQTKKNIKPELGLFIDTLLSGTTYQGVGMTGFLLSKNIPLEKFDYIFAHDYISMILSYYDGSTSLKKDEDLFGYPMAPELLTYEVLDKMNATLAGIGSADQNTIVALSTKIIIQVFSGILPPDALWEAFNAEFYHRFVSSDPSKVHGIMAYDKEEMKDIMKLNPKLKETDFILMNRKKPFPITIANVFAAYDAAPTNKSVFPFSEQVTYEITPMYAGRVFRQFHKSKSLLTGEVAEFGLGGFVSNYLAMGISGKMRGIRRSNELLVTNAVSPTSPIATYASLVGLVSDPFPSNYVHRLEEDVLPEASAARGGINAGALGRGGYAKRVFRNSNVQERVVLGKGALSTGFASLIARGVKQIFGFFYTRPRLPKPSQFNPVDGPFNNNDLIAGAHLIVFGLDRRPQFAEVSATNQIFQASDFVEFYTQLNETCSSGNGGFVRMTATTVANVKYGIPAGLKVELIGIYPCIADNFFAKLPQNVQDELQPLLSAPIEDYGDHYNTTFADLLINDQFDLPARSYNLALQHGAYIAEHYYDRYKDVLDGNSLSVNDCRPKFGLNADECEARMNYCKDFGIELKFVTSFCNRRRPQKGLRGCQCKEYCAHPCRNSCDADPLCEWKRVPGSRKRISKCFHKGTNTIGQRLPECPKSDDDN